jgi:hypothetical protein
MMDNSATLFKTVLLTGESSENVILRSPDKIGMTKNLGAASKKDPSQLISFASFRMTI